MKKQEYKQPEPKQIRLPIQDLIDNMVAKKHTPPTAEQVEHFKRTWEWIAKIQAEREKEKADNQNQEKGK